MYYDGKQDETLTSVTKGAIKTTERATEEHVTIILETNGFKNPMLLRSLELPEI